MLYERWLEVVREHGDERALQHAASGRAWTFRELRAAAEAQTTPAAPAFFPRGNTPEFLFALLAAWRTGGLACPVEPDQTPPTVPPPPPWCRHLKMTSGTTGAARFVAFTPEQLAADAADIVATMGLRPEWPNLGVISAAHSYGFSNLVLPLLLHGVPLILAASPLPEAVRSAAAGAPKLTLAGVPFLWRAWHEAGAIPANVVLAISAGAPLPLNVERDIFERRGLKVHNFYGASECGGIAYDDSPEPRTDAALAGRPMRQVSLALTEAGCWSVRGPAVGETYWPEAAAALGGGTFVTSDLGELRDGRVYVRGRAGDQINVAGRKVSPETVERALLAHPRVRECLVFGVPGAQNGRGEVIVAVVAAEASEGELREFARAALPAWQVPREWRLVAALGAGPRGKLSRAEWRRRFAPETQKA